jgi:hypothetical protein
MKNILKNVFSVTAVLFSRACTICFFSSLAFFLLALGILEKATPAFTLSQYLLFFLFSFLLSASFYLFLIPLAKPLLLILHCLVCGVSFFAVFAIAGKIAFNSTAQVFVAIILFIVVYAVIYALARLVKFLLAKAGFTAKPLLKKDEAEKEKEVPAYEKRF